VTGNFFVSGVLLRKCVGGVCEVWEREEETLNRLDRGSGDGDCGSTLKAGAIGECDCKLSFPLVL